MIKKYYFIGTVFVLIFCTAMLFGLVTNCATPDESKKNRNNAENTNSISSEYMKLPEPEKDGKMSLEKALTLRRSIRSYTDAPLTVAEIGQLLWSAQGITLEERGYRTAPSAGATFPLEMYLVVNDSEVFKQGIYHYNPHEHSVTLIRTGNYANDLRRSCMGQSMLSDASVVLIFGAIFERTTSRYGERGERYVYNEIGHASQNVHLQVAALDLGTVVIGAYSDEEVEKILDLDENVRILYLMPVGNIN